MTLSIDGTDIGQIIEVASWVGSIVAMLIVGLIVYFMVRKPRHLRGRRKEEVRRPELDEAGAEDLWRVVDRMESRLEVLERALADKDERPAIGGRGTETELVTAPVASDRDSGRTE